MEQASVSGTTRMNLRLSALGVFVVCAVVLLYSAPNTPVTDDAARDQLYAQDCTDLGQCHTVGAPTSVHGFRQGALWIDLLAAIRWLGRDVDLARHFVVFLNAAALAILFVVARKFRRDVALPAAMLGLLVVSASAISAQLINPSAAPIAGMLCVSSMLFYALGGGVSFLLAASVTLSIGLNLHVGAVSLVPSLTFIAILGSAKPLTGLLIAAASFAVTGLSTSAGAWNANLTELRERHLTWWAAAGLVSLAVFGAVVRPRFRRWPRTSRAWFVVFVVLAPFLAGVAWLFSQHHDFGLTYLHPVLGPACVVAIAIVMEPFRRWTGPRSQLVVSSLVALVLLFGAGRMAEKMRNRGWSFERIGWQARMMRNTGWSFDQLYGRIQGPECRNLLAVLSVYMDTSRIGSPPSPEVQLQPDRGALQSSDFPVQALRAINSWMRPDISMITCRERPERPNEATCARATMPDTSLGTRLRSDRTWLASNSIDVAPPYIARYEIALRPTPGFRNFEVLDTGPPACRWRISSVTGVRTIDRLPTEHVRLLSDRGDPGTIVVEKPYGTAACAGEGDDIRYPPCFQESFQESGPGPAGQGAPPAEHATPSPPFIAVPDAKYALTTRTDEKFRELLRLVETGAAGADVRTANISILHDQVQVELLMRDGNRQIYRLVHPSAAIPMRSKVFGIVALDGATEEKRFRLTGVLNRVFVDDPFIRESDGMDAAETTAASSPGSGLADRLGGPLRPGTVMILVLLHLIALTACTLAVWRGALTQET